MHIVGVFSRSTYLHFDLYVVCQQTNTKGIAGQSAYCRGVVQAEIIGGVKICSIVSFSVTLNLVIGDLNLKLYDFSVAM